MSTRDLINAIIAGDAIQIETAFNSTMADKISASIDALRQDVAQNMFQTEEVEQIEELSKKTLGSYAKKANKDTEHRAYDQGGDDELGLRRSARNDRKLKNRLKGVNSAVDRMTKEEVEQIEEAIDAKDYTTTSEKSQFGGHRPKVVHKTTGKVMHLSQHSYKKPEDAKAHAQAYLSAYHSTGANAADRAGHAYAKDNKDQLSDITKS